MKKLLLLSGLLLSSFFVNSQAVQDWTSSLAPLNNYNNHMIASDSQGNVYTIGNYDGVSRDFDPGPGVFTMSSISSNMYILKLNALGNFVWAKQIGGSGSTSFTTADALYIDASDNLYISGMSYGISGGIDFDPGVGVFNVTNPSGYIMFILKLDANGNHILNKQFTNGTNDSRNHINAIKVDSTGNMYATGCFGGTLDFDPDAGTTNLTQFGTYAYSNALFIFKLNSSGSLAWAKTMINTGVGGNNFTDQGYGIDVDSAGNVYTVGYYWGGIDADPGTGTYNLTSYLSSNPTIVGANTLFISKLDAAGNFVWAYDLVGDHSIAALPSLVVDNANNVIVSGYQQNGIAVDYDLTTGVNLLPSDTNSFVLKINSNAGFIWAKSTARDTVGYGHGNYAPGLTLDAAGNIYTAGTFGYYSPVDFDPSPANYILTTPTGGSNADGYISKLDTNGNFVWATQIGGTGQEGCFSIAVSPIGKVTVLGKTTTGFTKSVAAVTTGGFLASYTQPALATSQFELDKNIAVYPNPTTGEFNIKINEDLIGSKVSVYNIVGQKIKDFYLDVLTTTQSLNSGMYLLEIEKDGSKTTRKLIVN